MVAPSEPFSLVELDDGAYRREEWARGGGSEVVLGLGEDEEVERSGSSAQGVSSTSSQGGGLPQRGLDTGDSDEDTPVGKGTKVRRGRRGGRGTRKGKEERKAHRRREQTKAKAGKSKDDKILEVMRLITELYPAGRWSEDEVRRVVDEAYRTGDGDFGEEAAIAWGADFAWPEDVRVRDDTLAKDSGFDLETMVKAQHAMRASDRLSKERVEQMVPDSDPDRERLMSLVEGMVVLTADDFAPSGRPQKMRGLYKRVKNAVNKVLAETWREGLAFIVTRDTADKIAATSGKFQFNTVSWAPKKDKPQGRNICDSSDDSAGNALNSEEAAAKLEGMYGRIEHPTLEELMGMVNGFADEMKAKMGSTFKWEDLRLWKGDLRKAFTLLNVRPADVRFFACELSDGLVLLYHTGLFGWTGTPFCFQVITRVIQRLVQARVKGRMKMFVDDGMGITMRQHLQHDVSVMREVCEQLLGPLAIAEDKWEWGRRLTWIGWDIDLDRQRVTISRRNFMKTLFGIFSVNEDRVQVRELEKVASWASRYSVILRVMDPFSKALYAELTGMVNRFAYKPLRSVGARVSLWMWRVMLCLLHLDEETFGRSFGSFRAQEADILVEFDASLSGVGLIFTDLRNNQPIGCGSAQFPFHLNESRWQNSAEFMAVVVAIICLAQMGISGVGIKLKGDSISALRWGAEEHVSSSLCFCAALVFALLSVALDIHVVEWEHIPGEEHFFCDALSRGYRPEDLGVAAHEILDLGSDEIRWGLMLCDPTKEIENEGDFLGLWRGIQDLMKSLKEHDKARKRQRR